MIIAIEGPEPPVVDLEAIRNFKQKNRRSLLLSLKSCFTGSVTLDYVSFLI